MDEDVLDKAIKLHQLVEEEDVECRPEKLSDALADENVHVCLVRKYFTNDAWMVVEEAVKHKWDKITWTCRSSHHDLHTEPSIILTLVYYGSTSCAWD